MEVDERLALLSIEPHRNRLPPVPGGLRIVGNAALEPIEFGQSAVVDEVGLTVDRPDGQIAADERNAPVAALIDEGAQDEGLLRHRRPETGRAGEEDVVGAPLLEGAVDEDGVEGVHGQRGLKGEGKAESGRPTADLLDIEVLRGAVEVGKQRRAQPKLERRVAGHVCGRVDAAAAFRLLEARVNLVARDGRGREVDRAPVDGRVLVAAAEDIEDVVGAADERLDRDVAPIIVKDPLVVVAVEREREESVAAGLGGPLAGGEKREIHVVEFLGVGLRHKPPPNPLPDTISVNLDALKTLGFQANLGADFPGQLRYTRRVSSGMLVRMVRMALSRS